jgi:hypothetical protein
MEEIALPSEPSGAAPDRVVRIATENSRTFKFTDQAFEEE